MGKWAQYQKVYKKEWEKEENFKNWLEKVDNDDTLAHCRCCNTKLRAHKNDLKKHAESSKHKAAFVKLHPVKSQQRLSNLGIAVESASVKRAELSLAVHVACHSSVNTVDHLSEIINSTFIESEPSSKKLKLHRTKCSALIMNVVAPAMLQDLLKDIGNSKFSLIIDESTDISSIKYMCICIKYHSVSQYTVVTSFLGLVEVTSTTSEILYGKLKKFLNSLGLSITNCIGLGTDGANNMCGCNNSLFTHIKQDVPNLILLKCICHSIHLCSSHAADKLPSDLEFLLREVYNWFVVSPLRQEAYKETYQLLYPGEKALKFVQLSKTRWLSRANAIKIIADQWYALKVHFGIASTKEHCYTAHLLHKMFSDEKNYLYFLFLQPILLELNRVNLLFQQDTADFFSLNSELKALVLQMLRRILIGKYANLEANLECQMIYRPLSEIDYGYSFREKCHQLLNNGALLEVDIQLIQLQCQLYLKSICTELLKRLPSAIDQLERITCLSPHICLSQTVRSNFSELPLNLVDMSGLEVIEMENEYRNLLFIDWKKYFEGEIPVHNSVEFWSKIFLYQDAGGTQVFKTISSFALRILTLPISNAVVERIFSQMNLVKSKIRNRLRLCMLEAILRIRTVLQCKKECCVQFVPTSVMVQKFNSSMYGVSETTLEDAAEILGGI